MVAKLRESSALLRLSKTGPFSTQAWRSVAKCGRGVGPKNRKLCGRPMSMAPKGKEGDIRRDARQMHFSRKIYRRLQS